MLFSRKQSSTLLKAQNYFKLAKVSGKLSTETKQQVLVNA